MDKGRTRELLALLLLVALALLFFASKATPQIAPDDAVWLQGKAPTVFDRYRQIPRFFFVSLHSLFGASALAALALIFAFHALNGLLLYGLARRWLVSADEGEPGEEQGYWTGRLAALVAAGVFLVNPITLSTLTWISCLSYVQGTTLALLALLAFWQATAHRRGRRWAWSAVALAAFAAGLFCSHEIFFLPALFLLLAWLRCDLRLGSTLFVLGMGLALLVNLLVYDFGRYGVEAGRLLGLDFALAYGSSALSLGLALVVTYPLSFFIRTVAFLQFCFTEPVRWATTAALVVAAVWGSRRNGKRQLALSLALAFVALITPYIIRLYLTLETANYHISYMLSGRVFYLAFVPVALILGIAVAWVSRPLQGRRVAGLMLLLPLVSYGHALWLYNRSDFLGLNLVRSLAVPAPPRWNPYLDQQPWWPLLAGVLVALLLAVRSVLVRCGCNEFE